jgi:citrate lyase alpha subunit
MGDKQTFIGKKPCGCVVFAMVDEPDPSDYYRKELAKELAKAIRQGLTIEKVPVEYVRNLEHFGCDCNDPKKIKAESTMQGKLI